MRKRRGRWAAYTAIVLAGAMAIAAIVIEPGIKTERAGVPCTHSVKTVMADLHYERRIKLIREELDGVSWDQVTALFLSMYPIRSYDTYYLSHWRGLETYKAEATLENGRELAGTLAYLWEEGVLPETVLLGLDPECLEPEYPLEDSLLRLARQTPETCYEVLLAAPSMAYWRQKADGEWETAMDRYGETAELLMQEENIKLFYAGDVEWLVCNGGNYEEERMPAGDVAKALLAYFTKGELRLTGENLGGRLADARELVAGWRADDRVLPGMRGRVLVFIGDSTFGNFSGSMAITGVVEEFTGASVVNCGYGGMSAAYGDSECPAMGDLIQAIERSDGSALGQSGEGGPPAACTASVLRQALGQGEGAAIFLDFGINDYINAFPIGGEDSRDPSTYRGAMREGIERLQAMFPQALLALVSPNYIIYNQYGTLPVGEEGHVFADYVDAVLGLAAEYQLPLLDCYGGLGIDSGNAREYLQDEIHLNEAGRFAAGMQLLGLLRESGFGGQ